MIYSVVVNNLNKKTLSNPSKSIAEAMLDGSIEIKDLRSINDTMAFPPNNFNRLQLTEGEYSSQEAMMNFVRTIGEYLSDKNLYKIVHSLTEIEIDADTQAYRTSTLAKCFMVYEIERHAAKNLNGELPPAILSHMQQFILPLCEKNWPNALESNVNKFVEFNINNVLMGKQFQEQYKGKNFYQQIKNFDEHQFSHEILNSKVPKDSSVLLIELNKDRNTILQQICLKSGYLSHNIEELKVTEKTIEQNKDPKRKLILKEKRSQIMTAIQGLENGIRQLEDKLSQPQPDKRDTKPESPPPIANKKIK